MDVGAVCMAGPPWTGEPRGVLVVCADEPSDDRTQAAPCGPPCTCMLWPHASHASMCASVHPAARSGRPSAPPRQAPSWYVGLAAMSPGHVVAPEIAACQRRCCCIAHTADAPFVRVQVIRKHQIDPAMMSGLKVKAWPVWESLTGGW